MARSTSNASNSRRLMTTSPEDFSSGISILCCPSMVKRMIPGEELGSPWTRWEIPSESRIGQTAGFRQSPQTLSLGKRADSSKRTFIPALAQRAAQELPAGPAPITMRSHFFTRRSPRRSRQAVVLSVLEAIDRRSVLQALDVPIRSGVHSRECLH